VRGVFLATRAKLAELHAIWIVATILLGCVISLLAIIALECNDGANVFLLGCHSNLPTFSIIQ
jgi:predicted membrane protein